MLRAPSWLHCRVLGVLLALGCSSNKAIAPELEGGDPDIVRPLPGEPLLKKLPGPMLGPYDSYSDALIAACNKIFTKPHASAGQKDHPQFDVRWRVSSEYCAWLYYTPDEKYVVSKLTDQTLVDPALRSHQCVLPSIVEDKRYPPGSIKHIYALHNHLYDDRVSNQDIRFIVAEAREHGFESETKDGRLKLSIVAFLANDFENPSCDGFYQYIPATHQILKWTRAQGGWLCKQTHLVQWLDDDSRVSVEETNEPCSRKSNP
jgi:hypothetical protein